MNLILPEPLYYESHITIEPVFDERLELFSLLCSKHRFKPAKLLFQKREHDTPERSTKDSFCTGHGKDYDGLKQRMELLVKDLKENNFKIWRQKIESVLYDFKMSRS